MPKKKKAKLTRASKQEALVVFFTTFDSREDAHKFARTLVQQRLAACVQVIPHITSFYSWQNEMHEAPELLCIGKTTVSGFKRLAKEIKKYHTYKLPELVALPLAGAYGPYAQWVRMGVGKT